MQRRIERGRPSGGYPIPGVLYIETKLALTKAVKARRQRQHMTQVALAERMKTSQSRVAKIEKGDPTVSVDLILRALFTLGVSRKELAKAI